MITSTDLLHLPYTPDLSEGGIAYACRILAGARNSQTRTGSGNTVERMRRMAAGVAVDLAFRRHLSTQGVPFQSRGVSPFETPQRYDISLGRHRCIVVNYLITRRAQVAQIQQNPPILLQVPALVPLEQFAAEGGQPDDLFLFAFLPAEVAASHEEIGRDLALGKPAHLIHPLPDEWAHPAEWLPLEDLALKSDCETLLSLEIFGQNREREFTSTSLELAPRTRLVAGQGFYSLAGLHPGRMPEGRIGLHSALRGEPYLVAPYGWGNLWVGGVQIILAGWLSREEFRRKARVLKPGVSTFQFARTRVKNLSVPIEELNPLEPLLARVKNWEAERSKPAS
jgi:hypothetical protein